jgi:hypothetical protein
MPTERNQSTLTRACPNTAFLATNPIWSGWESNEVLRGDRPTNKHFSHGKAPPILIKSSVRS